MPRTLCVTAWLNLAASLTARRRPVPFSRTLLGKLPRRHAFSAVAFTRIWTVRREPEQEELAEETKEHLLLVAAMVSSTLPRAHALLEDEHKACLGLAEVCVHPQVVHAMP